jgi:hypothetical protein
MSEAAARRIKAERRPFKIQTVSDAAATLTLGCNEVNVSITTNRTFTLLHPSLTHGVGRITITLVARSGGALTVTNGLGGTLTSAMDAANDRIIVESNGIEYDIVVNDIA